MSIHQLNRSEFGNPANAGNLMTIEEAHILLNEWVPTNISCSKTLSSSFQSCCSDFDTVNKNSDNQQQKRKFI